MLTPIIDRRLVTVHVRRRAVIDMLMTTIEAVVIPPLLRAQSEDKFAAFARLQRRQPEVFCTPPLSLVFSNTGLPVAGILFGDEIQDAGSVTFIVERMFASSANRHDFGIWPNPYSPTVMAEVANAAGLGSNVIGDFRSRPLLEQTPGEIEVSRGYRWSREKDTAPEFEGDRVSLVTTITGSTGATVSALPNKGPVNHFRFNKWEIWLAAMLRDRRVPTQGPELIVESLAV